MALHGMLHLGERGGPFLESLPVVLFENLIINHGMISKRALSQDSVRNIEKE